MEATLVNGDVKTAPTFIENGIIDDSKNIECNKNGNSDNNIDEISLNNCSPSKKHLSVKKNTDVSSDSENLIVSPETNSSITNSDASKKRKKDDKQLNSDTLNVNNRPRRNTPRKSVFEMLQGNEDEASTKKAKKNHLEFSSDSEIEKSSIKKAIIAKPDSFEPELFEGPMLERKERRRRLGNETKSNEKKRKQEPMKAINLFENEPDDSSCEDNVNGSMKPDSEAKDEDNKDEEEEKQPWFVKQSQETNDRLRLEELSQINSELRARIAELEGGDRMTAGENLHGKKFNFDFQSGKFNRVKNSLEKEGSSKRLRDGDVASDDKDKRRHESIIEWQQTKLAAIDAELDQRIANVRESEGRIMRAERSLREKKEALDYKEKILKASKSESTKVAEPVGDSEEIQKIKLALIEREKVLERREEEVTKRELKVKLLEENMLKESTENEKMDVDCEDNLIEKASMSRDVQIPID